MAITISGENNNDRILAADGVIDQISGINIVGLITASHINVGSNIHIGNAGIITATTFTGNLTGNVNSTSPLLLQTGGSERFRITGDNALGIAGANYGSSGQVLTSGGSGSAVTWSAIPSQVSIASNADNRVITGGSGTNLVGEANLTYDGTTLTNGAGGLALQSTGGELINVTSTAANSRSTIKFNTNGNDWEIGARGSSADNPNNFYIYDSATTSYRMLINSTGVVSISGDLDVDGHTNLDNVSIAGVTTVSNKTQVNSLGIGIIPIDHHHIHIESANPRVLIRSTGTNAAKILFGDNSSNDPGVIEYSHSANSMMFNTGNLERLRIISTGDLSLRTTTQNAYLGLTANSTAINFTLGATAGTSPRIYLKGTGNGQSDAGDVFIGAGTGGIVNIRSAGLMKFEVNSDSSTLEALSIASDGKFGFNTTSPSAYALATFNSANGIQLQGDSQSRILMRNNTGGTNEKMMDIHCNGSINIRTINDDYTTATTRATFRTDGNFVVGNRVGTSSPSTNQPVAFHSTNITPHGMARRVSTGQRCNLFVGSNSGWASGDGGVIAMGGSETGGAGVEGVWAYVTGKRQSGNGWEYAGYFEVGTSPYSGTTMAKRVRIWANGQIELYPTDNTIISTQVGGAQRLILEHTGGGNMRFRNTSSGSVTYQTSSDYRLKENVVNITNALTTVKALKPYEYKWKHDGKLGQGFFAHEAQETLPDIGIVSGTKDGVHAEDETENGGQWKKGDPIYQSIDYSKLVPLLTAALQEETAKREALEARLAALEGS